MKKEKKKIDGDFSKTKIGIQTNKAKKTKMSSQTQPQPLGDVETAILREYCERMYDTTERCALRMALAYIKDEPLETLGYEMEMPPFMAESDENETRLTRDIGRIFSGHFAYQMTMGKKIVEFQAKNMSMVVKVDLKNEKMQVKIYWVDAAECKKMKKMLKTMDQKAGIMCHNDSCRKFSTSMMKCGKCKYVHYCSPECQAVSWKNGHKENCKNICDERLKQTN